MTSNSTCKQSRALKIGFIVFLVILYGWYYPWLMYNALPTVEGEFHLNSQNICEALATSCNGWSHANTRVGEFTTYLLYGVPLHIVLSIVHPLFMLLLAVGTQRIGTGKYPEFTTSSLAILCYVSLFITTASPVADWWLDNFNWVYPCGVAMLFFALSEPLFRQQNISNKRFVLLLFLGAVAAMGNEVLALTVCPLFAAAAGWELLRKKRFFRDYRYWVLVVELLGCLIFYFSSPCWSWRMGALGFSPSIWERLGQMLDIARYWSLTSYAYDIIALITIIAAIIASKKLKGTPAPSAQLRFNLLLLAGLGYFLLTLVIPGYPPHREYRVLQFFFISVFAGAMGLITARRHGERVVAWLLIPVAAAAFTYLWIPVKESYIRGKLWDNIATAIQQKPQTHGIVYFSEKEWNALVEDAHMFNGQRCYSIKEHDRLVIKINSPVAADKLLQHKENITLYSICDAAEQGEVINMATVREEILQRCSPDIVLNRGLVQRLGIRGLVVVKGAYPYINGVYRFALKVLVAVKTKHTMKRCRHIFNNLLTEDLLRIEKSTETQP